MPGKKAPDWPDYNFSFKRQGPATLMLPRFEDQHLPLVLWGKLLAVVRMKVCSGSLLILFLTPCRRRFPAPIMTKQDFLLLSPSIKTIKY